MSCKLFNTARMQWHIIILWFNKDAWCHASSSTRLACTLFNTAGMQCSRRQLIPIFDKPAFSRISLNSKPRIVVKIFGKFVKRQVCQKWGWVADGWCNDISSSCDLTKTHGVPCSRRQLVPFFSTISISNISTNILRWIGGWHFCRNVRNVCSPNEDFGRPNEPFRVRFRSTFQRFLA